MIFSEPLELREREEGKWEEFEEYMKENKLTKLPDYYTTKERISFRFL